MNVNHVEFQKRESGITWITFHGENGEIEVYPMNPRDSLALDLFLSNPDQMELHLRDNIRPGIVRASKCNTHGNYYGNGNCPRCDERMETLDYASMRQFLFDWMYITKDAAKNYVDAAKKYGATPVFPIGGGQAIGYLKVAGTKSSEFGRDKVMFSYTPAE